MSDASRTSLSSRGRVDHRPPLDPEAEQRRRTPSIERAATIEPAATIELDAAGVVLTIDAAAEALLADRTALGRPLAERATADDRATLLTLLADLRPGGTALRTELGLRCADGHELHAAIIAVPAGDPAARAPVTTYLRDVSRQHATERVLA